MAIFTFINPADVKLFDKTPPNNNNIKALAGLKMNESEILQSWKDISAYIDRDIRTCHRWEREFGLPVHRIDEKSPRSKVFAYKSEIDLWLREKANNKNHLKSSIWDRKGLIIGLISGLGLLSLILGSLYLSRGSAGSSSPEPTLAVLPFENLNSSEYEEYFSEGLTNEITNSLIKLNKIKVVPAVENSQYENTPENLPKINRDLNVDYFLLGKIEKGENDIRIILNLIRGKDNENIWNQEFESDLQGIFSVEEEICQKIHEKLSIDLDDRSLMHTSSGATRNYGAYDVYLKGNFILNRIIEQDDDPWKLYHQGNYYLGRFTPESNEMAIRFFNQAIELDKSYARAYIGLAQCYTHYVNFEWDSEIEWLDKAEALLNKAQKISPDIEEYYSTLIEINLLRKDCFQEGSLENTIQMAEEAIKKFPNHPQLNSITGYCYLLRFGEKGDEADFEKAYQYKERSFLLNQYSINNVKFAELILLKKDFYKAIEVCQNIESAGPSLYSEAMMGEVYYYAGDLDKSREIFLQFDYPLNFRIYSLYFLAMIATQKGEADEAQRLIQKLETLKPEEYGDYDDALRLASIYFGLGYKELGYEHLEIFLKKEFTKKEWYIKTKYLEIDRNFDQVRHEDRFQKIIKGE